MLFPSVPILNIPPGLVGVCTFAPVIPNTPAKVDPSAIVAESTQMAVSAGALIGTIGAAGLHATDFGKAPVIMMFIV
jgi:hypothetical protein